MTNRLGVAFSAYAFQRYRLLGRRYRKARAETRRLKIQLRRETEQREVEVENVRLELREADNRAELQGERADNAEIALERAQNDIDILKARDELWALWESRERARLEAEAARHAAAKVRALEYPLNDQEG